MSHLIQRQVLDVRLPNNGRENEQQETIRQLYWERIVPALDEVFSKIVPDDVTLRIDQLKLDVATVSTDNLVAEIIEQVTAQLKDVFFKVQYEHQQEDIQSSTQVDKKETTLIARRESYAKALIFFLANGIFPWWFKSDKGKSPKALIERVIAENPEVLIHFLEIQRGPQIQKRLIAQFSEAQLLQLVEIKEAQLSAVLSQALVSFLDIDVSKFCDKLRWKNAIQLSIKKGALLLLTRAQPTSIPATELGTNVLLHISMNLEKSIEVIRSFINRGVVQEQGFVFEKFRKAFGFEEGFLEDSQSKQGNSLKERIDRSKEDSDVENLREDFVSFKRETALQAESQQQFDQDSSRIIQTELKQGIYITNAGLVLIAPFLQRYLEAVDLLEDQKFTSIEAQERALLLTQHLVSGQTAFAEHELFFNKIITGWPLADPAAATIALSAKEESETQDLLHAVIKHWGALGESGVAALQETFLQREGKLISKDDQYKLIVERKTVDILMDKIPWSFSIIKLPWMKKRIQVEW